jgi:hypothetical protein
MAFDGRKELVNAILILFTLAIIMLFIKDVGRTESIGSFEMWSRTCRQSVQTATLISTKTHGIKSTELHCPTKYFEVKPDGIYYNNKLWRATPKGTRKEVVEKALADDLASCWNAFAIKNINPVNMSGFSYCFICSQWHFDEDIGNFSITNFINYLNTTEMPNHETYYDFLSKFPDSSRVYNANKNGFGMVSNTPVNTSVSRDYITTFTFISSKNIINNIPIPAVLKLMGPSYAKVKHDLFISAFILPNYRLIFMTFRPENEKTLGNLACTNLGNKQEEQAIQ